MSEPIVSTGYTTRIDQLEADNARLQAENRRLREALCHIANVAGNWQAHFNYDESKGLPLKGVIKDGKVEWKEVEDG